MPSINWGDADNAADEVNKPAPDGRYILEVKSVKEGESKNGGHYQVIIQWAIAEGPSKGKTMTDYLTFNFEKPVTISMARNTAALLGFENFKDANWVNPTTREKLTIGKRIEADVETNEWNGRKTNRIKQKIRAIAGGSAAAPDGGLTPPPKNDVPTAAAPTNPMAGI